MRAGKSAASAEASPDLRRLIDRVALFLSLVGLSALLVGGVGIGNAVRGHIAAKTATIATLKCLGAPTRLVFAVYLCEIMALALVAILAALTHRGVAADSRGAADRHICCRSRPGSAIYPDRSPWAALYGLLTTLVFSLWPLAAIGTDPGRRLVPRHGRPCPTPHSAAALRRARCWRCAWRRLIVAGTQDRHVALWFVAGAVGAFALFWGAGRGDRLWREPVSPPAPAGAAPGARQSAPAGRPDLRKSCCRSGSGLTVLVAVALVEGNLGRQIARAAAGRGTGVFLHRHPAGATRRLRDDRARHSRLRVSDEVPMMRGRITRLNGVPVETRGGGARGTLGVAQRPRPDLFGRVAEGLAARRRNLVAGRLSRPAADLVRRRSRPRHGAQDRRHADASTCSAARSPRASPISGRSIGSGSASISRSCLPPALSNTRRRPTSPRSICRKPKRKPWSAASPSSSRTSRQSMSARRSPRSAGSSA